MEAHNPSQPSETSEVRKSGHYAQNPQHHSQTDILSVPELAQRCTEETGKFLKQLKSDDRYCLELFRRAIAMRDEQAWSSVYQQYAPLVLTWVMQHQSVVTLIGQDSAPSLVNAAFAKFFQALSPAKLSHFETLAAILKYLKMCAHSVVADEVRAYQARQYEDTLELIKQEPASEDPAEDVIANLAVQTLWEVIQDELRSDDERLLVYLAYVQGMKPGEISRIHQHYFPAVDDVYRIKRNVLERLRRNRRLQTILRF